MFARLLSGGVLGVWKSKPFMGKRRPLGVFTHRLGERKEILAAVCPRCCLHFFLRDEGIKRWGEGEEQQAHLS